MQGRRRQPDAYGWFRDKLEPGDYVRVAPTANADGTPLREDFPKRWKDPYWLACSPNGHAGNLQNHDVTEHEDGTISVSPSILISDDSGVLWHGYLEHGVWRSV